MKRKNIFASLVLAAMVSAVCLAVSARTHERTSDPASLRPTAMQEESDGVKHSITAEDLKKRLDKKEKTFILDSRGTVNGETIKGSVHVPVAQVEDWAKTISKDAFIVTFCTCPHDEAADASVAKLRGLGFKNAFSLKGGLNAAQQTGIPTVEVGG
jgi:rhodanese-related sulfurtransferase